MTYKFLKSIAAVTIFPVFFCCHTQSAQEDLPLDQWPEITKEAKPWTRWWWMGNAVDKENIEFLLETYQEAGLGGVEIAPIYGAKGFEDRYLDFLSEEWLTALETTVQKAQQLGMGVDMTQGTGWPFGGPHVSPEFAASRIAIQDYEVGGNPIRIQYKKRDERELDAKLLALLAYGENGSAENITDKIDKNGNLKASFPEKTQIKAVFLAKTGQMVKRAAPGGAGLTLDHYSEAAVDVYLAHFEKAFGEKYPAFRSFYNDSFELYGADFTETFFEEFEKRRGYDLKNHLHELLGNEGTETSIRIKSDYRETLNALLLDNFTKKWTDWAHSKGKLTKNQAHGSPGNLLDLYGTVDIPEAETFGSSYFPIPGLRRDSADIRNVDPDPIMLKFASSAAHLTGKKLVSSETFTWLGEHFKSSFSQMKPEVDQAFLAGVNHIFYHGVTYSPKDVPFPGWLFYASLNLTQHNSLWPHFREFNAYIARTQSVLQLGKADNELLVYWPVYDVWANPKGMLDLITVHGIDEWLHPTAFYQESKALIEKGYSLDFISDDMIANSKAKEGNILPHPDAFPAKALLIPRMEFMSIKTLENILQLANEGATVIFQAKPMDAPGLQTLGNGKNQINEIWAKLDLNDFGTTKTWGKGKVILSNDFSKTLENEGIRREELVDSGLKFIRRSTDTETYYFLVNHSPETVDKKIPLSISAKSLILMDPLTGKIGLAKSDNQGNQTRVRIRLAPGESMVLRATNKPAQKISNWIYATSLTNSFEIPGPWKLAFDPKGGPETPKATEIPKIVPWTTLEDPLASFYSGLGTYSSHFEFHPESGQQHVLVFDTIHESAKVWINDRYAGQVWSLPFRLDIGDHLKSGQNNIRIEVANLMANHIRYLDQQEISWRNYHEINFVNIDYKSFDASDWKVMPSGISGPVKIISLGME
ncbi:hypothetical protein P872_16945 [Rhodonellum psychrophilum GCM71 = DSM 17998]|uniref:Beta-mannosidase-like galactose-binding domain-containing protein n=2 Tax=Rhodonellum TaxID=336827 RepID=U5BRJ8_9BACT|nr:MULTISPECIES: glycosyl hydrolase [Rhodonellum]ERM83210.1 hypothetical protein P872_16945 [Rhodonellum psychrophilum GCM71 = DSM 17998]SDZ14250.1 Glycosyl hydrolases family 2, sugar binding domain [Rhodonellum ikkaensis]